MSQTGIRTDLALEAQQLWKKHAGAVTALPGVKAEEYQKGNFTVSLVEILDSRGEAALGKPQGRYLTVALDAFVRREENAFSEAAALLADLLRETAGLDNNGSYLVVGLGNRDITPDAIGPEAVDHILVTRHLKEKLPEDFAFFRPVCAFCSGVLGTTGIESSALVKAVTEMVRPDVVFAVDALAARDMERLCRTVQISDTGIVPGSGVGNARQALNRDTLGVPVVAIGVPTVVDAATMTLELAARAGVSLHASSLGELGGMIVTPREIDRNVKDIAKLVGYALNLAFHPGLNITDIDMLLS